MSQPTFSSEQLEFLEKQHIEFLKTRLVSADAEKEWLNQFDAVFQAVVLDAKLKDLIDVDSLGAFLESIASSSALREGLRPLVRVIQKRTTDELKKDKRPLGRFVPDDARKKLDKLCEQKGLVPAKLVRELVEHEAVEDVLRDALFDALKQFSEKVNPFFADWGLPALVRRIMPIGGGAFMKSLELLRSDFDSRLEPEIRKFLKSFSRASLRRSADFTIDHLEEPKFIALRKRLVAFTLEQPVSEIVGNPQPESLELVNDIAFSITTHVSALDEVKEQRRALLQTLSGEIGDRTTREALALFGASLQVDTALLAKALWPTIKTALTSEPVQKWLSGLVHEFYQQMPTTPTAETSAPQEKANE